MLLKPHKLWAKLGAISLLAFCYLGSAVSCHVFINLSGEYVEEEIEIRIIYPNACHPHGSIIINPCTGPF